jgi:hypothetical protein
VLPGLAGGGKERHQGVEIHRLDQVMVEARLRGLGSPSYRTAVGERPGYDCRSVDEIRDVN